MFAERINDNSLAAIAKAMPTKLTRAQGDVVRALAASADKHGVTDKRAFAYILGTAFHESNFKLIKEIRAPKYSSVWYMQEKYWHTGYFGRGPSQLTHKKNYQKFEVLLGIPLVKNPDLALLPEHASEILVMGMAWGLFTTKKLSDYFPDEKEADWLQARRMVNGMFMYDKVAIAALKIYQAIFPELF